MAESAAQDVWRERFVRADDLLPGPVASVVGYADQDLQQPIHRGLPSPYLTFIVTLDEPVVSGFTPDEALGPDPQKTLVVTSGLHLRPTYIAQSPLRPQSGMQLAVRPTAARALFGVPAAELFGLVAEGTDVIGPSLASVRARMIDQPDWAGRLDELQRYLLDQFGRHAERAEPRPELLEAWRWLVDHRGNGSIADLAEHVWLSQRQLRTLFVREYGVSPRSVNRLIRFHRTVRALAGRVERLPETGSGSPGSLPRLNLAELAIDCGYADQSHLDRDFRQFTGISPTGWLAEEYGNITTGGHRNGDDEEA